MGTPLHEDFQSTEYISETRSDLTENFLDQIEVEAEAKAVKTLMCTDLDEEEADNNQPLEKMENQTMSTKAKVIEELMEALLQDVVAHSAALKNEKLKKMAPEAKAIQELLNIYLDEAEETVEKHLGCKVMNAADTEAEASRLNMQTHLNETDTPTDQPLVMNSADTEAEAIKQPRQIHGDKTDTPNDQPLGCEVMSAADTEAEASTYSMQTHMEENDTPL